LTIWTSEKFLFALALVGPNEGYTFRSQNKYQWDKARQYDDDPRPRFRPCCRRRGRVRPKNWNRAASFNSLAYAIEPIGSVARARLSGSTANARLKV